MASFMQICIQALALHTLLAVSSLQHLYGCPYFAGCELNTVQSDWYFESIQN
jgi:hypothetical protein